MPRDFFEVDGKIDLTKYKLIQPHLPAEIKIMYYDTQVETVSDFKDQLMEFGCQDAQKNEYDMLTLSFKAFGTE